MAMGTFGALVEATGRCVDVGLLEGDPLTLATIFFGMVHGLTSLELLGWLPSPEQADAAWRRARLALYEGLRRVSTEV